MDDILKNLPIILVVLILFNSCEDNPVVDQGKQIELVLPAKQMDSLSFNDTYKYVGKINNGPAEEIIIGDEESFKDHYENGRGNYTGWLKAKLKNENNEFVLEGKPKRKGTYSFLIKIKREDADINNAGSVTKGLTIVVNK